MSSSKPVRKDVEARRRYDKNEDLTEYELKLRMIVVRHLWYIWITINNGVSNKYMGLLCVWESVRAIKGERFKTVARSQDNVGNVLQVWMKLLWNCSETEKAGAKVDTNKGRERNADRDAEKWYEDLQRQTDVKKTDALETPKRRYAYPQGLWRCLRQGSDSIPREPVQ